MWVPHPPTHMYYKVFQLLFACYVPLWMWYGIYSTHRIGSFKLPGNCLVFMVFKARRPASCFEDPSRKRHAQNARVKEMGEVSMLSVHL